MNAFDFWVYLTDPSERLRRAHARKVLNRYEATAPSPFRNKRRSNRAPNDIVQRDAASLRAIARDLERNHDIFRGALRVLVNSTIGATGIGVDPQPRRLDGTIHTAYAEQLADAYKRHCEKPEVTRKFSDSMAQRIMAYTWFRDGEGFGQQIYGEVPGLKHYTAVPYSIELFEPDFVPLDYSDPANRIKQGIQANAWGQALNYFVYKSDPRDNMGANWLSPQDIKAIPADRMMHIATLDRLHQFRGVSEFASVLTRIEDLKDYEESERIAAKIAASMTAYVKRTSPEGFDPSTIPDDRKDERGNILPRDIRMSPGMVFDDLLVGEEIGMVKSDRPNPNLVGWRAGQLKAFAAGIGAGYSSVSRNYDGTYSAQRQELVEQWMHYAVLADEFVCMWKQPDYKRFVQVAHLSGVVKRPWDVPEDRAADALYLGQSMPWIDPLKEVMAWEKRTQAGFASEQQAIRAAGGNPRDVRQQIVEWRTANDSMGLQFTSDARYMKGASGDSNAAQVDASNPSEPAPGNASAQN